MNYIVVFSTLHTQHYVAFALYSNINNLRVFIPKHVFPHPFPGWHRSDLGPPPPPPQSVHRVLVSSVLFLAIMNLWSTFISVYPSLTMVFYLAQHGRPAPDTPLAAGWPDGVSSSSRITCGWRMFTNIGEITWVVIMGDVFTVNYLILTQLTRCRTFVNNSRTKWNIPI